MPIPRNGVHQNGPAYEVRDEIKGRTLQGIVV